MVVKKLTLDDLRNGERAGGILSFGFEPEGGIRRWVDSSVPEDLVLAWEDMVKVKNKLNEMMRKYNFPS